MRILAPLFVTLGLAGAAAAETPPPYSIPWGLRPAAAATAVRFDTTFASHEGGSTLVTMLSGAYKATGSLVPTARLGIVSNSPDAGDGALSFVNPALGLSWLIWPVPELRVALFMGVTVPIGMGGGDSPDPDTAAATRAGALARSSMDNAMFAVNDVTVFPGLDVAWVKGGLTLQVEATVFQLFRVRGAGAQPDSTRTHFTAGLHAGYFPVPTVSVGVELRHQRFLSTPSTVEANAALRDQTSFAAGVRLHFRAGPRGWIRPGIAYARGFDDPMARGRYNVVQIDAVITL